MSATTQPQGTAVFEFSALSSYRTAEDGRVVRARLETELAALQEDLRRRSAERRAARSDLPAAEVQDEDESSAEAPESSSKEDSDRVEHCSVEHTVDLRCAAGSSQPGTDAVWLAPWPPVLDVSGEPLLPSIRLVNFTKRAFWPAILCVCAALGVILSTVALDIETEPTRSSLYMLGFMLLLVPLGMNTLVYGRAMTWQIISSNFEFWYLSLQILVFSTCETLQVLHVGLPLAVAVIPRIFLTGFAMVGLLCIDASRLSRVVKGVIMLVGALLFMALGATWRVNSPIGDDSVDMGLFETTVGSLATSSYVTLGVFCAKFAMQVLVLKRNVVLVTFSWRQDTITFLRRKKAPRPL